MMSLNRELVQTLDQKHLTCAVAESCTGGMVAAEITDVQGASRVFLGGVVAYTNEVKRGVLSVKRETLERFTAVSAEVAIEMAQGVLALTGADIAAAVTGNAGPEPSEGKPVGEVYVAVCSKRGSNAVALPPEAARTTRGVIRKAAVLCVLEMLNTAAAEF